MPPRAGITAERAEAQPAEASATPDPGPEAGGYRPRRAELARIALAAGGIAVTGLGLGIPPLGREAVGLAAVVIAGFPIYRTALTDVWRRRMTMELSMAIAVVAAAAIREFLTALVILLAVLVAEILEELTVRRGRRAIGDLLAMLPRQAEVRRDGELKKVDVAELRPGDIVVVRPGGRIPADGVVTAGQSFADQAAITGESLPAEKLPGAAVYAGSINQTGWLEVAIGKLGRDTAFGQIVAAVEHAESVRAPVQKTADQFAGYVVAFALGGALLTLLLTHSARDTISVVIVAGACGIAAGTPLAILGAIGQAAQQGVMVKGGLYMEALSRVGTIVLDKTGTLTLGQPEVVGLQAAEGTAPEELLHVAASAERFSEHPLGAAIRRRARELGVKASDPEGFSYTPGKGIICRIEGAEVLAGNRALMQTQGVTDWPWAEHDDAGTAIVVARGGRLLGRILLADQPRPEAAAAVGELRALGVRTILLTGDAEPIARAAAAELQVDEAAAELLPADKLQRVRALRAAGQVVAMVGDGVNDAPALLAANVGIAMGSGTEVARESAHVLLIGNDLRKVAEAIRIARRCRRIIVANFAGTLGVDAVGIALAALGFLNPMLAALIHVGSELVFISNSARLLAPAGPAAESRPAREATAA